MTEEAERAKNEGRGFILQGDMNSWLGLKIIPDDTREQNKNGKMFEAFLKSNKLTVVNSLPLCKGLTTRERMRQGVMVKIVLDFYVVCQNVLTSVTDMEVDNDRKYRLTNYKKKVRTEEKAVDTDLMTTILRVNMKVVPEKPKNIEIFDFKSLGKG